LGSGIFKLCRFKCSRDEPLFWRITNENARAVEYRLENRRVEMSAPRQIAVENHKMTALTTIFRSLPLVSQDRRIILGDAVVEKS